MIGCFVLISLRLRMVIIPTVLKENLVNRRDPSVGDGNINPLVGRVGYCLLEHGQLVLPLSYIALDKLSGTFRI